MYFYRARYYDPKVGRFVTKDPIGFGGGINVYAYVKNNAVNWTDPFGLAGIGGGAYYGGGADVSFNWTTCCENGTLFKVYTLTVCGGVGIGVKGTLPVGGTFDGVSSGSGCPRTRYYYKHQNDFLIRSVNVQGDSKGPSAGIDIGVFGIGTSWAFCSDTVMSRKKIGCCDK
jgi:uncharacterized protein RhaS with RHS repeats